MLYLYRKWAKCNFLTYFNTTNLHQRGGCYFALQLLGKMAFLKELLGPASCQYRVRDENMEQP